MLVRFLLLIFIFLSVLACADKEKLFTIRRGSEIGIDFQNTIITSDSLNALSFEYIYNGSGVGVGDFNNDGLEDLFFGGNQVSSKLYVNSGNLTFIDVTEAAELVTNQWITGVSIVDINSDGLDDIYLCVAGKTDSLNRQNLLFVNQGNKQGKPFFKELAKQYGVNDDSYSTMAAFFDYDKDGDLDLYLVNNWLESFNRNNLRPKRINGEAASNDKLYRNNGDNTFTDATRQAGILIEGYGLGVVVNDYNEDSWPDVYVSNDFMSNDLLWINQHDGTFKNEIDKYLKHQTHNGMGIDVSDFNNDSHNDIIVVDMLPPGHKRQKLMTPGQNYDHFHMSLNIGYQPQYMRNTLQLNRGKMKNGQVLFSEIGFMAGVAQTDWSWTPLLADFDNDGWKDLFIANGYRKDVTDLDFIFFGLAGESSPFGTPETRKEKFQKELDLLPEVKLSNYIFRNTGTLTFEDATNKWGIELPTFSNGAVYSDLDNDGDLDLITNNIDQEVIVYENNLNKRAQKNGYVQLESKDRTLNEKITLYNSGSVQYIERTPYRGFQSTVTKRIHFGIGELSSIDSIEVWWPDSTVATYKKISANSVIQFSKIDATKKKHIVVKKQSPIEFIEEPSIYSHVEKSPSDIKVVRTLLHELSRFGPCLAVGDVNNDKLDDFFIGSERGDSSLLFIQQSDGSFNGQGIGNELTREDGAALFFDADTDGDLDLYIASASPTCIDESARHVLYLNNGSGIFSLAIAALPEINTSASCVVSSDYDGDGDLDLFIGGQIKPNEYPLPPRSYILENNNGKFKDVTQKLNKVLKSPGVVTSAVWIDFDNDAKPDLAIAGEWMPIRLFLNKGNSFEEVTDEFGLSQTQGWWNCIKAADLNNDGFPEIIAGNAGTNSYFKATANKPIGIIAKDFDKNGSVDPIITYYNPIEREQFMVHNRLVIIEQIPALKKRFQTFNEYATTPFRSVFSKNDMQGAFIGEARTLSSSIFENKNGKSFKMTLLPEIAQISSINDILADDFNKDGYLDLILIGNSFSQETLFGRYDASLGCVLMGKDSLQWNVIDPFASNFIVPFDAKKIGFLKSKRKPTLIIINNNAPAQLYRIK